MPPDDPESSYGQVKRLLLGSVQIPPAQVHRVFGEQDPAEAAAGYRRELAACAAPGLDCPRFDLVLLGMGTDGHTASLFPGSAPDPAESALAVTGNYQDRPARRVTLSPRVLNAARQVFFMAVGANKADTLVKVLGGPPDEVNLPSQRIRPAAGEVTWLVDEAAATPKPIIGFFSLNICQIKSESLPPQEARKLPRDAAGVRLGRLAVAKTYQRQGIGKTLLVAAMGKFMEIFNSAGGIGLFVDVKDQEAKRYYEQFDFIAMPSNELELFLPVKTIQQALKA